MSSPLEQQHMPDTHTNETTEFTPSRYLNLPADSPADTNLGSDGAGTDAGTPHPMHRSIVSLAKEDAVESPSSDVSSPANRMDADAGDDETDHGPSPSTMQAMETIARRDHRAAIEEDDMPSSSPLSPSRLSSTKHAADRTSDAATPKEADRASSVVASQDYAYADERAHSQPRIREEVMEVDDNNENEKGSDDPASRHKRQKLAPAQETGSSAPSTAVQASVRDSTTAHSHPLEAQTSSSRVEDGEERVQEEAPQRDENVVRRLDFDSLPGEAVPDFDDAELNATYEKQQAEHDAKVKAVHKEFRDLSERFTKWLYRGSQLQDTRARCRLQTELDKNTNLQKKNRADRESMMAFCQSIKEAYEKLFEASAPASRASSEVGPYIARWQDTTIMDRGQKTYDQPKEREDP